MVYNVLVSEKAYEKLCTKLNPLLELPFDNKFLNDLTSRDYDPIECFGTLFKFVYIINRIPLKLQKPGWKKKIKLFTEESANLLEKHLGSIGGGESYLEAEIQKFINLTNKKIVSQQINKIFDLSEIYHVSTTYTSRWNKLLTVCEKVEQAYCFYIDIVSPQKREISLEWYVCNNFSRKYLAEDKLNKV